MSKGKIYRSLTDRMIAGVCGGIAEYFNLDSTVVRLAFVLFVILGGSGLIFYIIAMIFIPAPPH